MKTDNYSSDKLEDFEKRPSIERDDELYDFHLERVKQGMQEIKQGLLVPNEDVIKRISDLLMQELSQAEPF